MSTPVARNSNFNRVVNHSVAHGYVIPTRDTLLSIRVKPTMPDPRIHVIKTKKSSSWWTRGETVSRTQSSPILIRVCLLLQKEICEFGNRREIIE